ncbi:hypothetical protein HK104_005840 [Borealophlyctis nickersoniae]|nr:hypothetical protein HK104_005840 [Borealophlyctis nickersoniae]
MTTEASNPRQTANVPRALTVAGSDSGGGAGIQADLKTFNSFNVFGTSVLTALTAQNTVGVHGIHPVPADFVEQQLGAVLDDIGADAVKTDEPELFGDIPQGSITSQKGMLFSAEIIEIVARSFESRSINNLVVDPVMVATSGDRLLSPDAVDSLRRRLLPLARVLTPNVPEAEILASCGPIRTLDDMRAAAKTLKEFGAEYILLKGGHLPFDAEGNPVQANVVETSDSPLWCIDVLFDGQEFKLFRSPYVKTRNTHGTGCTLASAIAAGLAKGHEVPRSVEDAMKFVRKGLETSFSIGKGAGPLNHFHTNVVPSNHWSKSFVDLLKSSCAAEWKAYTDHAFVRGLADGTLPVESFRHYIRQDYIFLTHYARANALASFREHEMEDIVKAAEIVTYIGHEIKLHVKYCEEWGISLEELTATKEATANLAYTRYVLDKGMSGDRLDLRVAIAPCLLGYGEIGMRLANDPATKREGNPYWPWIQNYAKDDYQAAVREGEELLEKLAAEMIPESNKKRVAQLCDVFRQATVLEINFWDMGLNVLQ